MLNQRVRHYDIVSEIASGGYGAVYRAHDTSVDRDVAIKVILPEHASNGEFKTRFEGEAKLVAQLEHPHIVPLYAYWQDEQGAFLVMRFIKGGNLRDLLQTQGALSLTQVTRWLEHLAGALTVAHNNEVVHRDLKPDNILLDDLGNAYLTDFGIAKQLDRASQITEADSIMGTWHYLSPEQIQSQPVTPRTDIYALGIMLYEMLTGTHPYKDDHIAMMVNKHLTEPLPPVRDVRPDMPYDLDDIIAKATAKDPSERYTNVNDLLNDFQAIFNNDAAVSASTSTDIEPLARPESITPEDRNRYAMLDNVRSFWVEGILEKSLYNAVWIELGMSERLDAVDNPWQSVLKVPDAPDETLPTGTTISETFDRLKGKLLILGEPGSGKTTTLLTLTRDLLNRAEWDNAYPIPVVFNLSSWAENRKSLPEWMVDELNLKYQVPRKIGQAWIDSEGILPLLDGLDEVALDHRNACVDIINDYRTEHGFIDVVVCSRIADYEALTSKLRLNGAIVLQPLQRDQVDSYLQQAGDGLNAVRQVLEDDAKLQQLTTSPLMLNILTLAYRDLDVSEIQQFDTLAGRRKHLFDMYVRRMLERRGDDTPYTIEQTRSYMSWLAKNMSREAQSVFHIENMQRDWLQTRIQRGLFALIAGFPAIVGIELTLFIIVYILGLVVVDLPTASFLAINALWLNLLYIVLGAFEILPMWKEYDRFHHIQPVERIRWSFSLRQTLRTTFSGGFGGAVLGAGIMLVILPEMSQLYGSPAILASLVFPAVFIVIGSFVGLLWGLTLGNVQFQTIETRTIPNQGIRLSAKNMSRAFAVIMTIFAIGLGLFMFNIEGVRSNIGLSLMQARILLTVLSLLVTLPLIVLLSAPLGGFAVYKHVILRIILWLSGQAPRNLARFLDYASSRILMRKVGGGYVFLHRLLLDYFANQDTNTDMIDDESERLERLADNDDIDDDSLESHQQQAQESDDMV